MLSTDNLETPDNHQCRMSPVNALKAVLLGPDGKGSTCGSAEDNRIIEESLATIERQLDLMAYEIVRLKSAGQVNDVGADMADGMDKLVDKIT